MLESLCVFNWTKKFNLFLFSKHLHYHNRLQLYLFSKPRIYISFRKNDAKYLACWFWKILNLFGWCSIWRLSARTKIARTVMLTHLMRKRKHQAMLPITFSSQHKTTLPSQLLWIIRGKARLQANLIQWLCRIW